MSESDASVERLLAGVVPAKRQRDARMMLDLVVGCIYIQDLTVVDLAILEQIIEASYATLTAGTYTLRGRKRLTTHGSRSTPTARGMGRVEQSPPLT